MKVILTEAGVDPGVWKPHAVRSASSSHHTTSRQLDLEQICRLADWSMASSTYLKFYKRYVWVLPPFYYCSILWSTSLYWKLRLIYLSTSSLYLFNTYLELLCIAKWNTLMFAFYTANKYCEFALGYMCFTYPLTDVHKATRSLECYAAFLLAPAEGWSLFTL